MIRGYFLDKVVLYATRKGIENEPGNVVGYLQGYTRSTTLLRGDVCPRKVVLNTLLLKVILEIRYQVVRNRQESLDGQDAVKS
jgi:hypothetical protein